MAHSGYRSNIFILLLFLGNAPLAWELLDILIMTLEICAMAMGIVNRLFFISAALVGGAMMASPASKAADCALEP
jgi:hypothetical protein